MRNGSETHETVLLDCTTGEAGSFAGSAIQLHQSSAVCFTVISHTPRRSRFYHIHIVPKQNWDGAYLMNLTQEIWLFFKCAIGSIVLLNLGETYHLKGHDMVMLWCTLLLLSWYDCMTSHGLNTYCDTTQCMNGLWIFITNYMNHPRVIHIHKQHLLKTMGCVW